MADQGDGEKNQIRLVSLEVLSDADARGLEHIQAFDQKQRRGKVDGQGDGDIPSDIRPATDPGRDTPTPRRRQHERLIVDAAGCGIDGRDLSQRRYYTQDDRRDNYPAPEHVRRATSGHGIRHGCRQTIRHRGQDEAHEYHLPC